MREMLEDPTPPNRNERSRFAPVAQRDLEESTIASIVLDELRAMREQLAALTSELRTRKQRAAKRVRSRRARLSHEPDPIYTPSQLDIARARKALR